MISSADGGNSYSNGDRGGPEDVPFDPPDGFAASCPACFVCAAPAAHTLTLLNARRSMLVAVGACAAHVRDAIAELSGLQAAADALQDRREEGT